VWRKVRVRMNEVIAAGVKTGKKGEKGSRKRLEKKEGTAYTPCTL